MFVPPLAVSLRMAEEGYNAYAFVTMAGPPISSPEHALLSPGIAAYSETGSLFGGNATELSVGQAATLICTVGNGSKPLSGTGYALVLQDCRVPPASGENSPQQTTTDTQNSVAAPVSIAASIPPTSLPVHDEKPFSREGANVALGQLVSRVEPDYPQNALQQQIEGTVKLHVIVGRDDAIHAIEAISGPPLLVPAATAAARQWHYKPTSLNAWPVEAGEEITVVFRLKHPN